MPQDPAAERFSPLRFGGFDQDRVAGLTRFVDNAVANDVSTATLRTGEVLNAREAAALQRLTKDELRTLASLREKVQSAAYGGVDPNTAAWACGLLC